MLEGAQFFGVVALPLPVALLVRAIASAWRGPPLRPFPLGDSVLCTGAEADEVRRRARLRGTMGGAGHVHPWRLAAPSVAWAAAAGALGSLAGGAVDAQRAAVFLGALSLCAAAVASALPATPFWYREARGGAVVVHPPAAVTGMRARPTRHSPHSRNGETVGEFTQVAAGLGQNAHLTAGGPPPKVEKVPVE